MLTQYTDNQYSIHQWIEIFKKEKLSAKMLASDPTMQSIDQVFMPPWGLFTTRTGDDSPLSPAYYWPLATVWLQIFNGEILLHSIHIKPNMLNQDI